MYIFYRLLWIGGRKERKWGEPLGALPKRDGGDWAQGLGRGDSKKDRFVPFSIT